MCVSQDDNSKMSAEQHLKAQNIANQVPVPKASGGKPPKRRSSRPTPKVAPYPHSQMPSVHQRGLPTSAQIPPTSKYQMRCMRCMGISS